MFHYVSPCFTHTSMKFFGFVCWGMFFSAFSHGNLVFGMVFEKISRYFWHQRLRGSTCQWFKGVHKKLFGECVGWWFCTHSTRKVFLWLILMKLPRPRRVWEVLVYLFSFLSFIFFIFASLEDKMAKLLDNHLPKVGNWMYLESWTLGAMNSVLGRSPDVVIFEHLRNVAPRGLKELCSFKKVSVGQMVKMVAGMVSCCSETLAQLYPSDKKTPFRWITANWQDLQGVISSLGWHLTIIWTCNKSKCTVFWVPNRLKFVDLCGQWILSVQNPQCFWLCFRANVDISIFTGQAMATSFRWPFSMFDPSYRRGK